MADDATPEATTASTTAPRLSDLIETRLSRRAVLGAAAAAPFLPLADSAAQSLRLTGAPPRFAAVVATTADAVTTPEGYEARTLIAWGDALYEGMAPFDPDALTREDQEKRFGQNNDMLALFPAAFAYPKARDQTRFLLCANHEYFEPALMFPAVASRTDFTPAHIETMYASVGVCVVAVERRDDGVWRIVRDPAPGAGRNRRITPFTPVKFSGAAATHPWIEAASARLREITPGAPEGEVACGTLANCAGGETPWGTYLTSEENFNGFFHCSDAAAPALVAAQADMAWLTASGNFETPLFARTGERRAPAQYDVSKSPYGPSLYGWVVEIDPYDPDWTPRKRTSLGRAKHECATTALTKDGRVAVYSGDDQIDEYVYKFVSRNRFNGADRTANRDLLDDGQLYAAQFSDSGAGRWIALTAAAANAARPLYAAEFRDAADVAMRAREAARYLGATPMDRPEDVEAIVDERWTGQGPVFIVCTSNKTAHAARPGNPRRELPGKRAPAFQPNVAGHILRLDEAGGDCGATTFRWDVFVLAGDPASQTGQFMAADGTDAYVSVNRRGRPTFTGDRFACPDNICFDSAFNIWISTDGSDQVFEDCNDAVLVTSATGTGPRPVKRFLVGPMGAEICGPTITPDEKAFLCAIQHPGESDVTGMPIRDLRWTLKRKPPSHFPDGPGSWPRAAVVVVTKKDGGVIGS
jgi:uncharacterized protein